MASAIEQSASDVDSESAAGLGRWLGQLLFWRHDRSGGPVDFEVPDPTYATFGVFPPDDSDALLLATPGQLTDAQIHDREITRAASRADPRWDEDPPPLYSQSTTRQ